MKKTLLTKLMLLLCALIAGSSSVWADTVTFNYADYKGGGTSSSGSPYKMEKTDVSIAESKFYCGSTNSYAQFYANGTITITPESGVTVTQIVLTASSESYNGYQSNGTVTASTGSVSGNTSSTEVTWTGTATEAFTISHNKQIRWTTIVVTYTKSATPLPSISADAVNLAYNATNGSIGYTISNPSSPAGTLTAAITAGNEGSWLSLGEVSTTVSLTCSANPTKAARTATVTLTYTYDTDKTVSRAVTVTQAGNPNVYDDISTITAISTAYAVKGTVVATNAKGLVIGDGTGYVYYYKNATVTQSVGDMITISGTSGSYGHVLQFTNSATVTETATSNYNSTPAVIDVDASAIATYNADLHLSDYVQFEGALAKDNNNNYNITVGTATARISYPTDNQKNALNNLVGKTVRVKGYFTGFSSSNFTVMLESAEEVVVPTIITTPTSRSGFFYMPGMGPSAAKTISVAGSNLNADISLSASTNYEICLTENGDYTNSITLTQTAGAVAATTVYVRMKTGLASNDYDGTITLTSTGASDVTVNLTGSVAALASLPFSWAGTNSAGSAELDAATGVDVNLGADFAASNAPYRLKFDGTTKYVTIYTNEKPKVVAFTAKLYNETTTGSKIKVQGSADGITFTDIEEFAISGAANATFQFTTTNSFDASHRAVKLIMSAKDQNVGVGSIAIFPATVPVTIGESKFTTFSFSSAVDFSGTDVTAYTAKVEGNVAKLTPITGNIVPANTGVILGADASGNYTGEVTTGGSVGDNELVAVSSDEAIEYEAGEGKYNYILQKNANTHEFGFYKATGAKLKAGKAYLRTTYNIAGAPCLKLEIEGDMTGINTVNGSGLKVNDEYYNLAGQRVALPTKGLYIVNGKKIVVK